MNESDFEDAIVRRLAANVGAGIVVQPVPENISEFKRPVDKPRITVGYDSSDYEHEITSDVMIQPEIVKGIITIQAFSLRGSAPRIGIYGLKKLVISILLGWTPPDCDMPIKLKYFGPPAHDPAFIDNMWYYELHFQTRAVEVQTFIPPVEEITSNFTEAITTDTLSQPLIQL